MSTKLYNGFKFSDPNMVIIRNQLGEFQKEIFNITADIITNLHVDMAIRCFDSRCMGIRLPYDSDPKDKPYVAARSYIVDKMDEVRKGSDMDSSYSFKFEIAVYPVTNRTTLGYHFSSQRVFEEALAKQKWWRDFHYQNQSDPPDDVTPRTWNDRRKMWDKVFSFSDTFSRAGFIMDLHDQYISFHNPRPSEIMRLIPSYSKRLKDITGERVSKTWYSHRKELKNPDSVSVSTYLELHQKYMKYLTTENGKRTWAKHEKYVCSKLKKKVTLSDLFHKEFLKNAKKEGNSFYFFNKK